MHLAAGLAARAQVTALLAGLKGGTLKVRRGREGRKWKGRGGEEKRRRERKGGREREIIWEFEPPLLNPVYTTML